MKKLELTRGLFSVVDDDDYERFKQYRWAANKVREGKFRAVANVDGKPIYLHRAIMEAPEGMTVDHIDGDPLNNQRSNLRLCTQAENTRNQKLSRRSKTGFKGVSYFKRDSRYRAYLKLSDKQLHLGYFDTAEEAAKAHDVAAREHFGAFASTNFDENGNFASAPVEHVPTETKKAGHRSRAGTKSGFRGVSWNCQHEKWWVRVYEGRKAHSIGLFRDPLEAAKAHDEAAKRILGDAARLNFPDEHR